MVDKSPRPKARPRGLGQKEPTVADQTGLATVEARADFDPALSWNPIARLGFEGFDKDTVTEFGKYRNPEGKIVEYDNAFYLPSRMTQVDAERSLRRNLVPDEVAMFVQPDSIVADVDQATPAVWSHEMTHRGFDRIIERINEHPEGPSMGVKEFKEKYGEGAFDLLINVDNETVTEAFDFLEDKVIAANPPEKTLDKRSVSSVKDIQKTLKADPEDRDVEKYEPYLKLMEAAQDMLTAKGEPPKSPKYEESMMDKIKYKLGYDEGGMIEEDKPMGFADQMQGLGFEVPSAPVEEKTASPLSRRPGFRGESAFDFSGFGDFLKDNVSEEELKTGLDNAGQWMVPFYESGANLANVVGEYSKPEEERDYDYIKEELGKAGESAAIEGAMWLLGGVATKYGGKGIKYLYDKVKQYEIDPNVTSAFGVGSLRKKDTFEEVMTPVKATKSGVKKTGEAILRPSVDLAEDLDPRMARAMAAETAGSIMPGPGKFFDPSKKGYKGDKFTGMLKDADIELDLEFGNYVMMGKGKPQDVSNQTFENLFVSARPSQKRTTFGQNNKSVARANIYDGPSLTVADMKANYKAATGKTGPEVRTNLLQPERFKMVTDEGDRLLDHPIVAVETKGTDGKHFYTLDTQFVGPVRMDRLTQKVKRTDKKTGKVTEEVPQPNLRPATVGDVKLGEQVGTIRVGKKDHPLYDYIEVDATMSAPEGMGSISKFNQGGMAMDGQMKAMFKSSRTGYAEGGEINAIDPVSGNEVPPGATEKEVRDDISIQVSQGEYVVPADVTRYYGIKFFEDLRNNAKAEMSDLQDDGRIGGQPLSEDPDDLTEDEMALLQEVMASEGQMGMAVGGTVTPAEVNAPDPYQQQATMYSGKPMGMATGGVTQLDPFGNPVSPTTQGSAPAVPGLAPVDTTSGNIYGLDTSEQTAPTVDIPVSGPTSTGTPTTTQDTGSEMKTVFYIHKDGRRISVLMLGDRPISSVPADFSEFVEDTPENRAKIGFGETTDGPSTEGATEQVDTSDDQDQTDDIDIKTKVDPDTPEGVKAMYDDSGVNVNDPVAGAKAALDKAIQLPKGAGVLAGAINPFLGVAAGVANAASQLTALSQAQANLQMAEFLGMDPEAAAIKAEIDKFTKNSPKVVQFLDEYVVKGDKRFNNALEASTSMLGTEDIPQIYYDKLSEKGKANVNKYIEGSTEGYKVVTGTETKSTIDDTPLREGTLVRTSTKDVGEELGGTKIGTDSTGTVNVYTPGESTIRPKARPDTTTTGTTAKTTTSTVKKPIVTSPATDVEKVKTTNVVNKTGSDVTIGQVSPGGQDAGDGFVWEKKEGTNALTRKYVGTSDSSSTSTTSTSSSSSSSDSSSSSSDDSGGCCFIMLEARYGNGTMDEVVRRYRDEYMTDRNRRGYYRLAEVLVPLMRKSKTFKWVVTKTFADPLVSYGKYYYGQNKHGVIYSPVKNFWMKVFDVVGGDTKFIRENGEVV